MKAISRYHYTKLTCFGQILLDNGGIKFAVNSSQILLASVALNSCADWPAYQTLFLSYKVRGIGVTLVPNKDQEIDYRGTIDRFPLAMWLIQMVLVLLLIL